MKRFVQTTLVLSALAVVIACSDDNDPATTTGDGDGDTSTGDGDTSTGDGDGDTTAGDGDGDTTTGDGDGDTSTGDGDGDTTTGDGDGGGELGDPPCDLSLTEAGEEIKKGVACGDNDPPLCYRGCGPNNVGWKSETCVGGVYDEGNCEFPTGQDYSCYAIPDTQSDDCPADTPQHGTECSIAECTVCNDADNNYMTSSGDVKTGYCVCAEFDAALGTGEWKCSSGTAWPCPFGEGC